MKKNIYHFIIAILVIGGMTSSCDHLDVTPESNWGVDEFYSNETEAEIALSGIYSLLATDNVYGQSLSIIMESGTDEGYYNRRYNENWTVGLYRHTAADNYVKNLWTNLYSSINMANMFNEKLKKSAFEEEEYNRLLAEARFLRGLCYFHLVNWYGDVPLRLNFTKDQSDNHLAPSPMKQVYEQVVEDLQFASEHLYHANNPNYEAGRANKMAAHGLLARVYLKMSGYPLKEDHYQDVIEECEVIINDAWHGLHQSAGDNLGYRKHFLSYIENNYDARESLFEISFSYLRELGISVDGRIGAINGVAFSYGGGQDGYPASYAMYNTTPNHRNAYDENDKRKDWNIANYQYTKKGDIIEVTSAMAPQFCPGKFRRWEPMNWEDLTNTPASGTTEPYLVLEKVPTLSKNFTSINFPVIRYADVLLMYAEAANEINNGPTAKAIEYLNAVRERAGLGTIETEKPGAIANHTNFFNEIVDERLRELCFEGLRKQDLIRWELLGTKLAETNASIKGDPDFISTNESHRAYLRSGNYFDESKHLSLPYPSQEVAINNELNQKAGW